MKRLSSVNRDVCSREGSCELKKECGQLELQFELLQGLEGTVSRADVPVPVRDALSFSFHRFEKQFFLPRTSALIEILIVFCRSGTSNPPGGQDVTALFHLKLRIVLGPRQ